MADKAETVLQALFAALPTPSGGAKHRNPSPTIDLPAGGLLVLRDGSRGDPIEEYLNPPTAIYRHAAALEMHFAQTDDAARSAGLAAIAEAVKTAIAGDRTLGDLVDYVEFQRGTVRDETEDGAAPIRVEDAALILEYAEDK